MIIRSAQYVAVSDGTPIAVTVHRPRLAVPVPVVLRATRYWRLPHDGEVERFTSAGLALALVDVRGTGASFGTWRPGWPRREIADLAEVVDWLVDQPWCSGAVGAWGRSYDANTALLLAAEGHPAVRAVVPRYCDYDPYSQISHPGGVFLSQMVGDWSRASYALDQGDYADLATLLGHESDEAGPDVLRVDEDTDGTLLAQALASHAANPRVIDMLSGQRHRDEHGPESIPRARRAELEKSETAIWLWGSWYDAGTGAGALEHFRGTSRPDRVTILSVSHGGVPTSPYTPPGAAPPSRAEAEAPHNTQTVRFLYDHLTGRPARRRVLEYWTIGTETLRQTTRWPPPGTGTYHLYFQPGGNLGDRPATGAVGHRVDPTTSTGPAANRWNQFNGSFGRPVGFPDRAEQDRKLLCHTGPPLSDPLELAGEPVVRLHLASTHPDGVVFAYLETVAPDGRVRCLTEGNLRLSHRATSPPEPGAPEPFHSHLAQDSAPMSPGVAEPVEFALLPLSAVLPAGERLRIALAGADQGTFGPVQADPGPTPGWTLDLAGCRLDLPVVTST